jgi:hypothetical protein
MNNRRFLVSGFFIIMGAGTIGMSFKFPAFFDKWVWYPLWPNIGDAIWLYITGFTLFVLGWVAALDKRVGQRFWPEDFEEGEKAHDTA